MREVLKIRNIWKPIKWLNVNVNTIYFKSEYISKSGLFSDLHRTRVRMSVCVYLLFMFLSYFHHLQRTIVAISLVHRRVCVCIFTRPIQPVDPYINFRFKSISRLRRFRDAAKILETLRANSRNAMHICVQKCALLRLHRNRKTESMRQ